MPTIFLAIVLFIAIVPIAVLVVVYLAYCRHRNAEEQLALELLALVKVDELRHADEVRRQEEDDRARWESEGGTVNGTNGH